MQRTKQNKLNLVVSVGPTRSLANNELDGWTTPNSRNETTKLQEKIMKKTISILAIAGFILALAPTAQAATIIDPSTLTATAGTENGTRVAQNAVDGSGMVSTGIHGNADPNNTVWFNGGTPASDWFKVDLGASYTVGKMYVWNGETGGEWDRGVGSADIYYSTVVTTEAIPTGGVGSGDWKLITAAQAFNSMPTDGSNYTATDTFNLNVTARQIGLYVTQGFGGNGGNSLAELQFEVPEPATMSLLAIGGIALIRRRRRA
jgi:hypothetical protein